MDDLLARRASFKKELLRLLELINRGASYADVAAQASALTGIVAGFDASAIEPLKVPAESLQCEIEARCAEAVQLQYGLYGAALRRKIDRLNAELGAAP